MTRQLIISVTCDLCEATVAEADAEAVKFTWACEVYEFDVCLTCAPSAESIDHLISVSRRLVDESLCCAECGFAAKNASGLKRHKTRAHPE